MGDISGTKISYGIGRNVLFDNLDYGQNFLVLYNNTQTHKQLYHRFLQHFSDKGSINLFVSAKNNPFQTSFGIRNSSFTKLDTATINKLKLDINKSVEEAEKGNKPVLLICDWADANMPSHSERGGGNEGDISPNEIFLQFLEQLIRKSKAAIPEQWKRKYGTKPRPSKLTLINAFEAAQLDSKDINRLIPLHERVYMFQENSSTLSLPGISPAAESVWPQKTALPVSTLEKLAKDNLGLLCLLFLEKKPQSGYQMLKSLAQHFHILLSQGTLYPMLYNLEKAGKITATNGTGREKIYELSPQAKDELAEKKRQTLQGYNHLTSFFE